MNTIYKEGKEELRARLRRVLTGCGVDPDILDYKQLQSADRLISVCEARLAQIHEHEESIASLKPTKSSIAQEAGLKRTTISESHNIALLKIYDTFFPKKIEESVPKITPRIIANENERMLSPPRMKMLRSTMSVVTEVTNVRVRVLLNDSLKRRAVARLG